MRGLIAVNLVCLGILSLCLAEPPAPAPTTAADRLLADRNRQLESENARLRGELAEAEARIARQDAALAARR
jgi:hypothetical protein